MSEQSEMLDAKTKALSEIQSAITGIDGRMNDARTRYAAALYGMQSCEKIAKEIAMECGLAKLIEARDAILDGMVKLSKQS